MTETLELPRDVYRKLAQGAAERGMTIQSLLTAVSELVVLPEQPTQRARQRSKHIDKLLGQFREGRLEAKGRRILDHLIEGDYQAANTRADRLISAKQRGTGNELPPERKPNGSSRAKSSR